MASAFSHALIGGAIGLLGAHAIRRQANPGSASDPAIVALPWTAALAAAVPDLDVLTHTLVAYSHPLGHRGAFHSLAVYAVCAAALCRLHRFRGVARYVFPSVFAAMTSHSLLDMLTNGGLGIGLWWPISSERFFFPWRPIVVSPLSVQAFFSERGMRVLESELPWAVPVFALSWWLSRRPRAAAGQRRAGPSDGEDEEAPGELPETDSDEIAVLEITDAIDLHAFAPRDILGVVDAYLEAAAEKGIAEVRLIHGRGTGYQRSQVQKLLRKHPLVLRFKDAPPTRGGWGATVAWLKSSQAPESER